jgi:hypothetical protein
MTLDDYSKIAERFGYKVVENGYKVKRMIEDNI